MNILIIGNGFDVANNLPTRYSNFLRMCEIAMDPRVAFGDATVYYPFLKEEDNIEFISFCSAVLRDRYNEFATIAKNNLFVYHFLIRRNVIGDKWMNFEEEIELLIESLIAEMHSATNEIFVDSSIVSIRNYAATNNLFRNTTYKDLFLLIREEHKKFARLLDIYMDGYINKHEIKRISGYKKGFYQHALSFNYTSTFSKHYEPEIDCCYIHGEARMNNSISRIILGFDDRYKNVSLSELESLPYEKFFQRLDLHTSNEYMMWLSTMSTKGNTIDIYGHSLAQADADILRAFITSPNTQTRIYYYSDLDRYEKMRNLTMILGAEKTIEMVGGLFPKISFFHVDDYSAS